MHRHDPYYGYRFNAGQFGVGHVPCGAEFRQEFSHLSEDRPTWDFGPKAFGFSSVFVTTAGRACDALPCRPAIPGQHDGLSGSNPVYPHFLTSEHTSDLCLGQLKMDMASTRFSVALSFEGFQDPRARRG